MEKSKITLEWLKELLPEANIEQGLQYPEIKVSAEKLHETAAVLKDNQDFPHDYLISLTAVDYLEKFIVVYHLENTTSHDLIVLMTDVTDREHAAVDTVSDLWPTAEFHEREVYDLFGIRFNNHPDLRRLFMEDDYGYPLRKDFKDEVNIIEYPN